MIMFVVVNLRMKWEWISFHGDPRLDLYRQQSNCLHLKWHNPETNGIICCGLQLWQKVYKGEMFLLKPEKLFWFINGILFKSSALTEM
jgi:hypothetical protein